MQPSQVRRRAFVLRVWQDETGHVWGQIAEPVSEWRRPFAGLEELWTILQQHLFPGEDAPLPDRAGE